MLINGVLAPNPKFLAQYLFTNIQKQTSKVTSSCWTESTIAPGYILCDCQTSIT